MLRHSSENEKNGLKKVLQKVARFCAYQERCESDVKRKLNSMGVTGEKAVRIIGQLKKEGFIDEERYAILFAGGKFQINGWGRIKIMKALKAKGIGDTDIRKGLDAIDEDEYFMKLKQLIEKKTKELKEDNFTRRKQKLVNFALGKGYESELIWKVIGE